MEPKGTDLEHAEQERNVFEHLFKLIERHSLRFDEAKINLGNFYEVVSNFDLQFQKFNHNEDCPNIDKYNALLSSTFAPFLSIFEINGFTDEPIFYAFKKFISYFSFVLENASNLKLNSDIEDNFYKTFPTLEGFRDKSIPETDNSTFKKFNFNDPQSHLSMDVIMEYKHLLSRLKANFSHQYYSMNYHDESELTGLRLSKFKEDFPKEIHVVYDEEGETNIVSLEKEYSVFSDEFVLKKIVWNQEKQTFGLIANEYYMIMDIEVGDSNNSASKLLQPLWMITSALESIEGVSIYIENISAGSILGRIRIFMKTLLAKEETKAVLETAKEAVAQNVVGVSYLDAKKSLTDNAKTKVETKAIEEEIKRLPTEEEAKFQTALSLAKQDLENKKLLQEIENVKGKLEIIEKLSDLAVKGILEADMIRIDINEVTYILKQDDLREIGPPIGEITGED